jgi:hypothetical protein
MVNISAHKITNRSITDVLTVTTGTPNTMAIDAASRFSAAGAYTLSDATRADFKLVPSNFINDGQYRIRIKVTVDVPVLNIKVPAGFYGVPDLGMAGVVDRELKLYPSNGSRVTVYIQYIDGEYEISARIAS